MYGGVTAQPSYRPPQTPSGGPARLVGAHHGFFPVERARSGHFGALRVLSPLKVDGLITRKRQGYRRQERPVDRPEQRAGHLSAQDSQLVAQNGDLDILGGL